MNREQLGKRKVEKDCKLSSQPRLALPSRGEGGQTRQGQRREKVFLTQLFLSMEGHERALGERT